MSQTSGKFCTACGNSLVNTAAICPKCGTPVQTLTPLAPMGKSKTTAIILAVFLGFWAWLYTFQVNKTKFFIALGAQVVITIVYLVSFFQYVAAQANYYDYSYNCDYLDYCTESYDTAALSSFLVTVCVVGLVGIGLRIWEIVDNVRRPESFYLNYPNER